MSRKTPFMNARAPSCRSCGERVLFVKVGEKMKVFNADDQTPHHCKAKVKRYTKAEIAEFEKARREGRV